jgi:proteic killer suppression protein
VIQTFADRHTQELYVTGRSRRFPPDVLGRILRKLGQLNAAAVFGDLAVPPSNRLHALGGTRQGQHSISVNMQWRICFVFRDGDAFDVEVCDYH